MKMIHARWAAGLCLLLGEVSSAGAQGRAAAKAPAPAAAKAAPAPNMESYQLVLLRRGPRWTPEESPAIHRLQQGHLAHLRKLGEAGKIVVAGPFDDQADQTMRGMCLYRVRSLAEARELAEADPAVQAGRLRVEVMSWWVEKGYLAFPHAPPAGPAAADGGEGERPGDPDAELTADFHGGFEIRSHIFAKVAALTEQQARALHGKQIAYAQGLVTTPWERCQVKQLAARALPLEELVQDWGGMPALVAAQRANPAAQRYQGQVRRIEVRCQGTPDLVQIVQTAPDTVVVLHDGVAFVAKRPKER